MQPKSNREWMWTSYKASCLFEVILAKEKTIKKTNKPGAWLKIMGTKSQSTTELLSQPEGWDGVEQNNVWDEKHKRCWKRKILIRSGLQQGIPQSPQIWRFILTPLTLHIENFSLTTLSHNTLDQGRMRTGKLRDLKRALGFWAYHLTRWGVLGCVLCEGK